MNTYENLYTEMIAKCEKIKDKTVVRLFNSQFRAIIDSLMLLAWIENTKPKLLSALVDEMHMDR